MLSSHIQYMPNRIRFALTLTEKLSEIKINLRLRLICMLTRYRFSNGFVFTAINIKGYFNQDGITFLISDDTLFEIFERPGSRRTNSYLNP